MRHKGKCLCGSVQLEAQVNVKHALHCHCQFCRKTHGAPFISVLVVPQAHFKILSGKEHLERYPKDADTARVQCRQCGAKLFADKGTSLPISLYTSVLEEQSDIRPMAHVNVESKCPWYIINDDLPQIQGEPTREEYLSLLQQVG